jgi:hypothetical protein
VVSVEESESESSSSLLTLVVVEEFDVPLEVVPIAFSEV